MLIPFVLERLAVRYLNGSLPNPIPCVLDILEVIVKDTAQPRFLPWEFDTLQYEILEKLVTCIPNPLNMKLHDGRRKRRHF